MKRENKNIVKKENKPEMEKEREVFEKMLTKAMDEQTKFIELQIKSSFDLIALKLENNHEKLDTIDGKVTKTNGMVAKHEEEIHKLKEANLVHVQNCPNTTKIANLLQMEVSRKAVQQFSWKQLVVVSFIIGSIIGVLQIIFGK